MRFQNTLLIDRFSLGFCFLLFSSLKIDTIYLNNYVRQTKLFSQFYVCCICLNERTHIRLNWDLRNKQIAWTCWFLNLFLLLSSLANIANRNKKRRKKTVNVMCWWCIRHKMNLNICQLYSDFNLKANLLHLMNRTHKNRTCNALSLSPSYLRPSGILGISNVVHQWVYFPFSSTHTYTPKFM